MATKRAFYFYVLYCQDGTLYGGYTVDLANRLATHNEGKGAKYTRVRKRLPVRMIYAERWDTKSRAMSAEAKFKRLTRPQKERYLKEHGQSDVNSQQLVLVNKFTDEVSVNNEQIEEHDKGATT
ncbi:GIY-YIG nuclease family protein [Aerococcaceae bacterium DSM 111021]|nr:GIY-YIG nuclease family protein [Aerococcaceae bacterium DSM 111021]